MQKRSRMSTNSIPKSKDNNLEYYHQNKKIHRKALYTKILAFGVILGVAAILVVVLYYTLKEPSKEASPEEGSPADFPSVVLPTPPKNLVKSNIEKYIDKIAISMAKKLNEAPTSYNFSNLPQIGSDSFFHVLFNLDAVQFLYISLLKCSLSHLSQSGFLENPSLKPFQTSYLEGLWEYNNLCNKWVNIMHAAYNLEMDKNLEKKIFKTQETDLPTSTFFSEEKEVKDYENMTLYAKFELLNSLLYVIEEPLRGALFGLVKYAGQEIPHNFFTEEEKIADITNQNYVNTISDLIRRNLDNTSRYAFFAFNKNLEIEFNGGLLNEMFKDKKCYLDLDDSYFKFLNNLEDTFKKEEIDKRVFVKFRIFYLEGNLNGEKIVVFVKEGEISYKKKNSAEVKKFDVEDGDKMEVTNMGLYTETSSEDKYKSPDK